MSFEGLEIISHVEPVSGYRDTQLANDAKLGSDLKPYKQVMSTERPGDCNNRCMEAAGEPSERSLDTLIEADLRMISVAIPNQTEAGGGPALHSDYFKGPSEAEADEVMSSNSTLLSEMWNQQKPDLPLILQL